MRPLQGGDDEKANCAVIGGKMASRKEKPRFEVGKRASMSNAEVPVGLLKQTLTHLSNQLTIVLKGWI